MIKIAFLFDYVWAKEETERQRDKVCEGGDITRTYSSVFIIIAI